MKVFRLLVFSIAAFGSSLFVLGEEADWTKCDGQPGMAGINCCDEQFRKLSDSCNHRYGPPMCVQGDAQMDENARYLNLEMCLHAALNSHATCLSFIPRPKVNALTIFPAGVGNLVLATHPQGTGILNTYLFTFNVPQGRGGLYVLRLLNGFEDPSFPLKARVAGQIAINGVYVVTEAQLNAQTSSVAVPITIVEGANTISISIKKTDGAWFGFLTPFLENYSN